MEQLQPGLCLQCSAYGTAVQHAIGLHARGAHRRTLAGVEYAELDTGTVGGLRHHPAEGIDFPYQVALADAADCRIAAHLSERVEVMGQQQGTCAQARRRQRGLGPGMATPDDNHVILPVMRSHDECALKKLSGILRPCLNRRQCRSRPEHRAYKDNNFSNIEYVLLDCPKVHHIRHEE